MFLNFFIKTAQAQELFRSRHPSGSISFPGDLTEGAPVSQFDIFNPLGITNLEEFIKRLFESITLLATPIVVIMIVWAAYLFVTSAGEKDKLTQARKTILWAVVGYGILLIADGLVFIVYDLFR